MRKWKFSFFKDLRRVIWLVLFCFLLQSFGLCCSLNDEGKALLKFKQGILSDPFDALSNWVDDEFGVDPCNWFGVECSDTKKL
jgi:hypothetical protein